MTDYVAVDDDLFERESLGNNGSFRNISNPSKNISLEKTPAEHQFLIFTSSKDLHTRGVSIH